MVVGGKSARVQPAAQPQAVGAKGDDDCADFGADFAAVAPTAPAKKVVIIEKSPSGLVPVGSVAPSATQSFAAVGNSTLLRDDLVVRPLWCMCSAFVRERDGAVDHAMEDKFASSRYRHFSGAFMQTSLLMPLGTLGQAVWAVLEKYYVRACILTGLIAPMYLLYALLVLKWEKRYLSLSGTASEKVLLGMLCLQSLAIVSAEFMRPILDYGMLVMHIGFVHNFSPLSEGAVHLATFVFGFLPYVVIKALRIATVDEIAPGPLDGNACNMRSSKVSRLLEILMPTVILVYQSVVTYGRFKSMRLDLLSSEQLKWQRRKLKIERTKCEGLLTSMLPRQIIESLKSSEPIEPQLFSDVTVIFVQICNFEALCTNFVKRPKFVVEILNILYLEFDNLSDMLDVYKVETVGDVYMAVVGCPEPTVNHADVAAHFALAIQESMPSLRDRIVATLMEDLSSDSEQATRTDEGKSATSSTPRDQLVVTRVDSDCMSLSVDEVMEKGMLSVRIGLNSGRLRAGVVGLECPRYKLVGDTVNTASRMESTCLPGRVQASATTYNRLTPGIFQTEDRGQIAVKGKGMMRTYFLTGYADGKGLDNREVVIEHGAGDDDGDEEELEHDQTLTEGGMVHRDSTFLNPPTSSSAQKWRYEFSRYGVLDNLAIPHGDGHSRMSIAGTASLPDLAGDHNRGSLSRLWEKLSVLFLLVPPSEKHRSFLATLRKDKPTFMEETLQKRVASARNVTIVWLLMLSLVSSIDIFLDVLEEDVETYRMAALFRCIGSFFIGLVYLLLITSPDLFRRYAQTLTLGMLLCQGVAMLGNGNMIYNSDPAIIAMYGAYVLFYKVCSITQRLSLCTLAVLGYMVGEMIDCGLGLNIRGDASRNFMFLMIFFICMACGVRLEEHLEHVAHFEQRRVVLRIADTTKAQAASSQLLESLLPPHVVELVADGKSPIAEVHSGVTIMFTDIKGFTALSSKISPQEVVDLLNAMYSAFDEIIVNWQLYKVEIIGDAYFVSAGCPPPADPEDRRPDKLAMRAVEVGLALQRALARTVEDDRLTMRVGLHSGSVVAGVVGKKGPRYHLFGPSVGYAEKMESTGVPGRVHLSSATHNLLVQGGHEYEFEERQIQIDDGVQVHTTYLVGRSKSKAALRVQKEIMMQRRASNAGRSSVSAPALPTMKSAPETTTR